MKNIFINFFSGMLLACAFPYPNQSILAWFAPSALIISILSSNVFQSIISGISFGIGFFGLLLYWINIFGTLPWIALVIYQSLFIALFAATANLLCRNNKTASIYFIIPSLWVSIEWLRSVGMFGFTWGDLGYSQYKVLPIIQIASVLGVWGISFLIILYSTSLADLYFKIRTSKYSFSIYKGFAVVSILVFAISACGYFHLLYNDSTGKSIKAAIVQGNIDQDAEEDETFIQESWDTYTRLTEEAAIHNPDLILWPESVVPGFMTELITKDKMFNLSSKSNVNILAGVWDNDDQGHIFNSAFLISPEGQIEGKYSKKHLVPFGEFVPARKYLKFLEYYNVTPYDTSPGKDDELLKVNNTPIAMAICFESIFPHITQREVKKGAEIICIITNDCWYDNTSAAEQHMSFSVLRAVENKRYVMRAASTGISCFIHPTGQIINKIDVMKEGILLADIPALKTNTIYSQYGDWFIILCIIVVIITLLNLTKHKMYYNCEQRSNNDT